MKASAGLPKDPKRPICSRAMAPMGSAALFFLTSSVACDGVVPVRSNLLIRFTSMMRALSSIHVSNSSLEMGRSVFWLGLPVRGC